MTQPGHFGRNILVGLLVVLAVIYLGICAFFYSEQDAMVFPAPKSFPTRTPAAAHLAFEDLHIPVNGSEQIHAWYLPAEAPSDKVLLFFHGNGYCIEQTVDPPMGELVPLHEIGANLLMADYRGYGASSGGQATEARVDEDARAALRYLTEVRKVPIHNIVIVGQSVGTGAATELAKENPNAGGLVLISPFTSTTDIGNRIWYLRMLPLRLISHNQLDNLAKADALHMPLLIAVGDHDTLTPAAMSQAILAKAREPKRLYIQPGLDHNGMLVDDSVELVAQIKEFLQTLR